MKTIASILFGFVLTASAQPSFPVLTCHDASYTNATVIQFIPARVVIRHDGGTTETCITNLPSDAAQAAVAQLYHPQAKAAQVEPTAQEKKAVIITDILDNWGRCNVRGIGRILMYGIPQATSDYFTQVKQLKDQIPIEEDRVARMKSDAARADANSNSYASGSPEFVAAQEAQWKKAANLKVDYEEAAANLKKMKGKLSDLELDFLKYAGVFAYPTGKAYSGVPIWQFVEMAP